MSIKGWVKTIRKQKNIAFIEVSDGSHFKSIQVVIEASDLVDKNTSTENNFESHLSHITTGSSIHVIGDVILSPAKGQKFEIRCKDIDLIGTCPDDYPLQKKRHSLEHLRSHAHLRPRTNIISAVARVRSTLAQATHEFFQSQGFLYLQTPIITSSDCEGAGEMFRVTTLPIDNPCAMPTIKSDSQKLCKTLSPLEVPSSSNPILEKDGDVDSSDPKLLQTDFSKDFFGKPTYLTVSGQLSGEAYASALGDIYTFGPTFRAENSHTTRHLAEFHMIEPEMAFADMREAMDNAEQYVKFVVGKTLQRCGDELAFLEMVNDKNLTSRLRNIVDLPFARLAYSNAIELLSKEIQSKQSKWKYSNLRFGSDLQTEHERWLAEKHFGKCVFIYDYPKAIKSFYMRDNQDGVTVGAFDLLVPGIGELIGGSQREERYEVLYEKIKQAQLGPENYQWYLDLRKYGSAPHSGYGLGFERLVCLVSGMENIRDAIAFPRVPGNAEF